MRLAIFDLDGTITRHDTLIPYVLGFLLCGRPWRLPLLLLMLPVVLGYILRIIGRGGLKAALIFLAMAGCRRTHVERWSAAFVAGLQPDGIFHEALAAIQAHARAGDHLVLLSASTDLYVPAIAQALGFQEVICTGVRWNGERLSGTLTTPNRRGEEKARCVTALRARYPGVQTVGYGNAESDIDHLKLVERGLLVNGSRSARRAAILAGMSCIDWR